MQQVDDVSGTARVHRLDIKLMEPTVFAVCPLTANQDIENLLAWLAQSELCYRTSRQPWQWFTRCACRNTDHCIHYVLTLRFHTRGEAMLFKLSWM